MMQFNMETLLKRLRINSKVIREVLAEFLGTFVLMLFGTASVAQAVLGGPTKGSMLSINLSWGLAVAMGIFVSGGISGGHLNPAVTLALATIGKFQWAKVIPFMLAQYLGSFIASATTYWVYYDALQNSGSFLNAVPETAGIFATYPSGKWLTAGNAFADQIVGTGMLMLIVSAITDPRNMQVPKGCIPIAVGLLVACIGMTLGLNCGYAINPARDFSPRLFTYIVGWGIEVFTYGDYYWWIPIVGPHVGAIIGGWTYHLLISLHWDSRDEETDEKSIKLETRF